MKIYLVLLACSIIGFNPLLSQCGIDGACSSSASSSAFSITTNSSDSLTFTFIDLKTKAEYTRKASSFDDDILEYSNPSGVTTFNITTGSVEETYIIKYEDGKQTQPFKLWKNSEVIYFFPKDFPLSLKAEIERVMEYIKATTNVCFKEHSSNTGNDVVYFQTNIHTKGKDQKALPAGQSLLGRVGGSQSLFINSQSPKNLLFGIILHELCHAIGLPHEHQLPIRDMFIKINDNNICGIRKHNFTKIAVLPRIYLPAYDIMSIMHYGPCSGSGNGKNTFDCIGYNECPKDVGQPTVLSSKDKDNINKMYPQKGCSDSDVTLFLFDTSGSMAEKNKTQQAKNAGISAINSIKKNNKPHDINIMSFAGGCSNNCVTGYFQDYTTDYDAAQTTIVSRINPPNGGTPLPQAIQVAEDNLKQYLTRKNLKKGRLIVMTDGESSCGKLRPDQVFQNGQYQKTVTVGQALSPQVQYFTVGFDIPAGSAAERDLQYLASISGGKYFNAQNEAELTRAFQKATKRYTPKSSPSTEHLTVDQSTNFSLGVEYIHTEHYEEALDTFKNFLKSVPNDCNGAYNLAIMCEASEKYKSAIQNYEKYLQLCPTTLDRTEVLNQIVILKKDYQDYVAFHKAIVKSDIEYLKGYFEKIQNGESIALAIEFIGFIKEKYDYYANFSSMIEKEDKTLKDLSKSISKSLLSCAKMIKKNPKAWDRDAVSEISVMNLDLKDLEIALK